ncbi:MAG: hypothetical protein IJ593_11460 [Lachnospiraceae bacterium]|nr:hypothetical protein [Lachnospiraceae bacterium]
MSNKILIKRGLSNDLNKAGVVDGELKYATDSKKLYIGDGTQNILLNGMEDITSKCSFMTGYSDFMSRTKIYKFCDLLLVSYFVVPTNSSTQLIAGQVIKLPYQVASRVDNCGKVQNYGNGEYYTMGNVRLENNYFWINDSQNYTNVSIFGQILSQIII